MRNTRRILTLALVLLLALGALAGQASAVKPVKVDRTHFPDAEFLEYVSKNVDKNRDGKLSTGEIKAVTSILTRRSNIVSMKGVELFVNLKQLDCSSNNIKKLDLSRNVKLENLNCSGNALTSLDVSRNPKLESLSCGRNALTRLNVSKNASLKRLNCNGNGLKTLDVRKNSELENLSCSENGLTKLAIGAHKQLFNLNCTKNKLKTVDVKGCPRLIAIVENTRPGKGGTDVIWMDEDGDNEACVWIDRKTKLVNGAKVLYKP